MDLGGDDVSEIGGRGWLAPEPAGLWTAGPSGDVIVTLPARAAGTKLKIKVLGRVFGSNLPGGRRLTVTITMGNASTRKDFTLASDDYTELEAPLPPDDSATATISFSRLIAPTPAEAGIGPDHRPLGFCLRRISVSEAE